MEPQDEPDLAGESRPPRLRGAGRRLRQRGSGLLEALSGLDERVQRWDEQHRASSFVPDAETVEIDARRHGLLLVTPALRTVAGVLVLAAGLDLAFVLLFAVLVAVWMRTCNGSGLRTTLVVAGATTGGLVVLGAMTGPLLCLVLLLGWLAEDVADWYTDRLIVTDKRIYRIHGVLTRHSPSISLASIAYIDAAVPPVGRLLRYGTLRLDSVAQRDAPLSRFDLIPDVVPVSHEILRLRTAAMPKYQQPF